MSEYDPKKDNQSNYDSDGGNDEEKGKLQFHPGTNPENQSEMILLMGD